MKASTPHSGDHLFTWPTPTRHQVCEGQQGLLHKGTVTLADVLGHQGPDHLTWRPPLVDVLQCKTLAIPTLHL